MYKTKIYGSNDDLIEVEGWVDAEWCGFAEGKKGVSFSTSGGTSGLIKYDGDWKIDVKVKGEDFEKICLSVGEDNEHSDPDALGCSSYSDVLVLKPRVDWVKISRNTYKSL